MSEFKSCPFCGGLNIRIANEREAYDGGHRWWCYEADVICECGALLHVDHGPTPFDGKWDTDETEFDFAVDAWNTRHVETCRCVDHGGYINRFECDKCGYVTIVHNCTVRLDELPSYCPCCGRKVEK